MNDLATNKTLTVLDPQALRQRFPIYRNNPGLVFLDSGASAQKPDSVIDGVAEFYRRDYANVHRGVYQLSQRSTDAFEIGREKTRAFLNAASADEVIFVRGATEAINLVAQSWGPANVRAGDEIVVSDLEHHSNFVPWQMLCERVGARLVVAPTDASGGFDLAAFEALVSDRTKMVALTHVSNVTGTIVPVERVVELAHAQDAKVLVDGCQAIPRMPVDVQALGCDFYAFSGHKAYGPSGIGVLWGRYALLERMPPWQTGGGMITQVTAGHTEFQPPPHRFEAGTPDISGAMGLGLALDFIESVGREAIEEHELELTGYALDRLSRIPGVELLKAGQRRQSVLSFNLAGVHPHDVGTVLDQHGVAVRVGHHCAHPLMDKHGIAGTVRVSLGVYNDRDDI
ncbi:MAG: cysteine desulfurase, partial [Alphaproteobacteria bacterium]|nr:cysteine desulfurase [Alphaproteobacteria bacterium]